MILKSMGPIAIDPGAKLKKQKRFSLNRGLIAKCQKLRGQFENSHLGWNGAVSIQTVHHLLRYPRENRLTGRKSDSSQPAAHDPSRPYDACHYWGHLMAFSGFIKGRERPRTKEDETNERTEKPGGKPERANTGTKREKPENRGETQTNEQRIPGGKTQKKKTAKKNTRSKNKKKTHRLKENAKKKNRQRQCRERVKRTQRRKRRRTERQRENRRPKQVKIRRNRGECLFGQQPHVFIAIVFVFK